ncbi:MAG: DUF503 domain-containing protein [Anaerolineae bacterium]|nr:DUF503 domain-containing protein [Anaerolineae bacterium]
MVVGVCTVSLMIPDAFSLKDKRHVVRSVVQRMRRKFNVSVAEVGDLDTWNQASIGIACVSNDRRYAEALLNKAVLWLENERLDAEIGDVSISVEQW